MNTLDSSKTCTQLDRSQDEKLSFEEIATNLPVPDVSISPNAADQLVFGCVAIGTLLAVSGLIKQFRRLIEVLDREEQ